MICRRTAPWSLLALYALVAPLTSEAVCTPGNPLVQADAPDVVLSAEIRAVAATLGFEPARIYEWVRNELRYEVYYGLMKGPAGALAARAGNDYDLAALLVSLLRVSEDVDGDCVLDPDEDLDGDGRLDGGTRARFVRGRIRVAVAEARAWTAADDGGETPAACAGNGACSLWYRAEPDGWRGQPGLGVEALPSAAPTHVEKLHVWVEADVSLAHYRGAGGDPRAASGASAGPSLTSWVPLDPSFKRQEIGPGLALPIGDAPGQIRFDPRSYYAEIQQQLPLEVFKGQVRSYLASSTAPAERGKTLGDVPYRGAIERVEAGVLPNALPYALSEALVPTRAASLELLHGADAPSTNPAIGRNGPGDYRYRLAVQTCASASGTTCAGIGIDWSTWAVDLLGRRLTLSYPSTAPATASCTPAADATPTLWLDGASVATAAPLPRCQSQTLLLTIGRPLNAREPQASYRVVVGSTIGIGIDMGWASISLVQKAADALVEAVEVVYPLGEDANGNGIIRTTGQLLASDYTAQEHVTGGLLHLAAERYFSELRRDYREIAALHHQIIQPAPWLGIVQSGLEVDATLAQPFLVRPARFLLDMQGIFYMNFDRSGVWISAFDHAVDLLSLQASAREHETWESLLDSEAISTVKGLQVQDEVGNPALVIESEADAAAATASCNTSNVIDWNVWFPNTLDMESATAASGLICPGLDYRTYCAIKERWAKDPWDADSDLKTVAEWTLINIPELYWVVYGGPVFRFAGYPATSDNFRGSPHATFYHWKALYWDAYKCPSGAADLYAYRQTHIRAAYHTPSRRPFTYFDFTGGVWVDKRYDLIDGQYFARTGMAIETSTGVLQGAYDLGLALDWGDLSLDDYSTGTSIDLDRLFTNGYPGYARWFDVDADTIGVRNHAWAVTDPFSAAFGGDPVSVATGNLNHTETDLETPGRGGLGLRLLRSYNSRLDYDGPLGHGWTHSYDQNLRVDASDPAARKMIFLDERGGETVFDDTASGLVAPAWSHLVLVRETSAGVTTGYRMTWKDGTVYRFLPENVQGKAKLLSITDRNGNAVALTYDSAGWLTAVTDTAGRQLVFENDASGHLAEIRDWASPQRRWSYTVDAAGDLISYMNPREVARGANGRATIYEYYGVIPNGPRLSHNLKRVIQPASRDADPEGDVWTQFYYYANDAVYKHTTSKGETTWFDYDFFRRRTTVTQPDGAREVFVFDRNLEVVRYESARGVVHEYEYAPGTRDRLVERDGFGRETRATYDGLGNLTSRTDRTGKIETFTYNGFSQPRSHTDRRGNVRRWEYDAKGNLLRSFVTIGGAEQLAEEVLHDAYGNPVERVAHPGPPGAAPARTRLEMASNAVDVARVIDPAGHSVRFTRDLLGRPTRVERERTVTSPSRTWTETVAVATEWDALDRAVAETDPAGTARKTIYDENGNVVRRETLVPGMPPRTDVTQIFDDADRLESVVDALGKTTRLEYDARGRLVRTISPLGNTSTLEYDPDGNVVKEIDPTGAITTHAYDAENRRTLSIDPVGRRTRTEYDAEGRVQRRYESGDPLIYPTGERLVYEALELDEEGNATRVRDAKGRETEITYDELGRKTLVRGPLFPVPQNPSPDESTTRFEYDLAGRLLARTEALGQPEERTTRVRYDVLGRPIEALDPLGRSRTYGYDEIGNTTVVHLPTGEEVRSQYDARGLVLARSGPGVQDEFAWDGYGRQTLAKNAAASRGVEYDALGRPVAIYDSGFGTARRVYDAEGRVEQAVYPDDPVRGFPGVVVTYGYDARGALVWISDPAAGTWQLDYDAAGRPVRQRDPSGIERTTSYDRSGFVSRIDVARPGGSVESFEYGGYDAAGNPGTIGTSEGTSSVTYDDRDRVKTIAYPGPQGSESFGYDRAGNRTLHVDRTGASRTYVVDAAGQLAEIRDTATQAVVERFGHDAAGRRISRTPASGLAEAYAYDGLGRLVRWTRGSGAGAMQLDLAYDALGERYRRTDAASPSTPSLYFGAWAELRGSERVRLVAGPGTDQVLAEITASHVTRTLVQDGSGNVTQVTEGTATVSTRRYEAFGTVRAQSGAASVERGYAGRPAEGASGLVPLRARHYDPATGRFLQSDPLGIEADQPYAYAANNPLVYRDPSGLKAVANVPGRPWSLASSLDGLDAWPYSSGLQGESAQGSSASPLSGALRILYDDEERVSAAAMSQGGLQPGDITPTMQAGEILRGYDVRNTISNYGSEIEGAASDYGVDANLIRAVIYEEQTHLVPLVESRAAERLGVGRTVGLGQVTVGYYGFSRSELLDPATNIRAMGIHLSTMGYFPPIDPAAPISSAGTRYNCLSCTSISPYGRRVEFYYGQFSRGVWP